MSFVSSNIKYLRKLKRYGQESLASALSLTQAAVSAYEVGKSQPTPDGLIILSDFFGVSIDDLLKKDLSLQEGQDIIDLEQTQLEVIKQEIAELRRAIDLLSATVQTRIPTPNNQLIDI